MDGCSGRNRCSVSEVSGISRISVLQVFIDEPGGGRGNVALLNSALSQDVEWHELPLSVPETRGVALCGRKLRKVIGKAASEANPAIIHCHGTRAALTVALSGLAIPRVATLHGIHVIRRSTTPQRPIATWFVRSVLSRMDAVLCTGRSDARLVQSLGLEPDVLVRWIHSTFTPPVPRSRIDARRSFDLGLDAKVILWMGRFEAEKNPLAFLEAIAGMRGREGLQVLMAGDGSLYGRVRDYLESNHLSSVVRLPGWCDDPALAYGASDIFVSTSRWEGFPLTGLEAASAGLTLVVTEVPGNADLAEVGLDVMLVPPDDTHRLAASLDAALQGDPPDRSRRNQVLDAFSPKVQRAEILEVYQRVLDQVA